MQRLSVLFEGRISRQQWWTGVSIITAFYLVWSVASEFLLPGSNGELTASLLSLLLLIPLAVLCAKRLNDLGRAVMPTLALLLSPFAIHTLLTRLTSLGARETVMETGFSDSQAVVLAPTVLGWLVLASLAAALAWMVVILGTRAGSDLATGEATTS